MIKVIPELETLSLPIPNFLKQLLTISEKEEWRTLLRSNSLLSKLEAMRKQEEYQEDVALLLRLLLEGSGLYFFITAPIIWKRN